MKTPPVIIHPARGDRRHFVTPEDVQIVLSRLPTELWARLRCVHLLIVLDRPSNTLPALQPFVPRVLKLLSAPLEPILYLVTKDGAVTQLGKSEGSSP